jgi:hypothetical protein
MRLFAFVIEAAKRPNIVGSLSKTGKFQPDNLYRR